MSQLVEVEDTNDASKPCPAPVVAPEPSPPSPPPPVLEELQDHTAWVAELKELECRRNETVHETLAAWRRWVKTRDILCDLLL